MGIAAFYTRPWPFRILVRRAEKRTALPEADAHDPRGVPPDLDQVGRDHSLGEPVRRLRKAELPE
jgi:hypothetical protein